jgi:hypothetical protein
MYRKPEDVTEALLSGKAKLRSMRNLVSNYRTAGRVDVVIMLMSGIEMFLWETKYKVGVEE